MTLQLDDERLRELVKQAVAAGAGAAARRGAPSWAVPLLLLLLFACGALLAAAVFVTIQQRERERTRLAAAAAAADGEHLGRMWNSLPAWALNPDASSCMWVNSVLAQLWPSLERFGSRFLKADNFLEHHLNAATFWRPAVLRSCYIWVQGVALGQEPPRVTGIKSFPKQGGLQDEVLLEYSFAWDSRMEAKLLVSLLGKAEAAAAQADGGSSGAPKLWGLQWLLSRASRVKVGVSDLAVRGSFRLSLKPLLDEFPFAGRAKVSLVGTPEFSYRINVLGGDPYLVPGVKLWVDSFIKEVVLLPFTFPDGFSYDLSTLSAAPFEKPEGLLEVAVVEASNVPRMDLIGKCDPYVKLWVRESQKMQTAPRSRTLSPVWNESFTFLVHSTEHQQLSLALFDSDMWPNSDDLIGRLSVPISSLDLSPGAINDLWLCVPRAGKKEYRKKRRGNAGGQQRVQAARVGYDGSGGGVGPSRPSSSAAAGPPKEGTTGMRSRAASYPAPPTPFAAAAGTGIDGAGQDNGGRRLEEPGTAQAGPASTMAPQSSPGMLRPGSGALEALRHLASNPLDALRSKDCQLHIVATFYPLSEQEIAAVAKAASRERGDGAWAPPSRTASLAADSRVSNMLKGGVLYVYLDRGSGLSSSRGFTRKMRVDVTVGTVHKRTERGKVPFRHRANPVFDETVELVVPGTVAEQPGVDVQLEVWVEHFVQRATFKGSVSIPLQRIIQTKRLRDTWQLHNAPSGRGSTLTAELSWLSTLSM